MTSRKVLSRFAFLAAVTGALALPGSARADTAIETETGDLGTKGDWNFSQSVQFEQAPDAKGFFTLNQYEYAITSRSEILIEPFFYEGVYPKGAPNIGGAGDLEITPSYMFLLEGTWNPALVQSFKVKVPTASNKDIGTQRFDFYPYWIINKNFGKLDMNANLGMEFFGQTKGEDYRRNQLIYDLLAQYPVMAEDKLLLCAEIFGNTKPSVSEDPTFAGSVALEYRIAKHFNFFMAVGYDSNKLWNVRPGFNIPFESK
jgi:hypothetical protein